MTRTPNISYSFVMRLEIPHKVGMLSKVMEAISECKFSQLFPQNPLKQPYSQSYFPAILTLISRPALLSNLFPQTDQPPILLYKFN